MESTHVGETPLAEDSIVARSWMKWSSEIIDRIGRKLTEAEYAHLMSQYVKGVKSENAQLGENK